jgi:uncharacterized protein YndB with AHSA1/START domain
MSEQAAVAPVRSTVVVEAPIERAFQVFTEQIDAWWPRDKKIGAADLQEAVLEAREGGRWYERDADGSECEWGRVLRCEPPRRLVLAWQIDGRWQYDPELVTEVDVRFIAESATRTRVELEHRDLERFGDHADGVRAAFTSPGGWPGLLDAYAQLAASGGAA